MKRLSVETCFGLTPKEHCTRQALRKFQMEVTPLPLVATSSSLQARFGKRELEKESKIGKTLDWQAVLRRKWSFNYPTPKLLDSLKIGTNTLNFAMKQMGSQL